MAAAAEGRLAIDLARALVPLKGGVSDDRTLFEIIGDAPIVLIAESTYGTHEFYRARAEITKRLVADRGFTAVCIEADAPGASRVNRYVRDASDDPDAAASLGDFDRFPAWLWRNAETVGFIAWLREYNDAARAKGRLQTGFYGLDDTLEHLIERLAIVHGPSKIVVWTHNQTNVTALARRRFGERAVAVGFTTYTGTVTAAPQWDAPAAPMRIVPARGDSYEYLFHATNVPRFLVPLRLHRPKLAGLPQQARERAIGVVYDPQSEPHAHYFTARLMEQFDALYHFDATRALEPPEAAWERPLVRPRAKQCG